MKRIITHLLFIAVAITFAACQPAGTQNASASPEAVDNSPERKAMILANLKHKYASINDLKPTLGEFKRVGGIDEVKMALHGPRGTQEQILIISPDNKNLYMVVEGPLDASRTVAELEAEKKNAASKQAKLLAALVEGRPVRGNKDSKNLVVEFSDFQCPYCSRGAETMEKVVEKYGKDVKFIYMHFPLGFHPWAKPGAIATECAGTQKHEAFWTLHDAYFKNVKELNVENIMAKSKDFLKDSGLDMALFEKCAGDDTSAEYKAALAIVDKQMEQAKELGVEGTPAFFLGGEMLPGAVPMAEFDRILGKPAVVASPVVPKAPAAPAAPKAEEKKAN